MNSPSVENRLLKGFARVVLDCDFSPEEAANAAKAISAGRITTALLGLLDALATDVDAKRKSSKEAVAVRDIRISRASGPRDPTSSEVSEMFDLVKRRKLTRSSLFELMDQLDFGASPDPEQAISIREALALFREHSSDADWRTLRDIIAGNVAVDPFLRGIMNR